MNCIIFVQAQNIWSLENEFCKQSTGLALVILNVKMFTHSLLGSNEAFSVWLYFVRLEMNSIIKFSEDYNKDLFENIYLNTIIS